MRSHHRSRGFTLIEVLIALLILAIGLLGLAALQTTGLRYNQTAYLRSQATVLAQSMMDYLRADRNTARDGDYDIALSDATPSGGNLPKHVLSDWRDAIADTLPDRNGSNAAGSVNVANDGTVRVEIEWGEQDQDAASGIVDRRFTFNSRL